MLDPFKSQGQPSTARDDRDASATNRTALHGDKSSEADQIGIPAPEEGKLSTPLELYHASQTARRAPHLAASSLTEPEATAEVADLTTRMLSLKPYTDSVQGATSDTGSSLSPGSLPQPKLTVKPSFSSTGKSRGCGVFADDHTIEPGRNVETVPLVAVLESELLATRCSHCLFSADDLCLQKKIEILRQEELKSTGTLPEEAAKHFAGRGSNPAWVVSEMLGAIDKIAMLDKLKCCLGPFAYPLMPFRNVLPVYLNLADPAHHAVVLQQLSPIPSFLVPGHPTRVHQASVNFAVACGRPDPAFWNTKTKTQSEADEIIEHGCRESLNALSEYELGVGKDSLRYRALVLEIKRMVVWIAYMMWRRVPESSEFGSKQNLFEIGRTPEDAAKYAGEAHPAQTPIALSRCSGCSVVQYCSRECQLKDWKQGHKQECQALQRWLKSKNTAPGSNRVYEVVPFTDIRGMARLIWLKTVSGHEQAWRAVNVLHSNLDPSDFERHRLYTLVATALTQYVGLEVIRDVFNESKDVVAFVTKWYSNAHYIKSFSSEDVGLASCPLASTVNHSCAPNAAVVFPWSHTSQKPILFQIRALRRIETGEEILISYTNLTRPTWKRQEALQDEFSFACDCISCSPRIEDPVDVRERIKCVNKNCTGHATLPLSAFWRGSKEYSKQRAQRLECVKCGQRWLIDVPKVIKCLNDLEEHVKDPSNPTWLENELLNKTGTITSLQELKCGLATLTYPLPQFQNLLNVYLKLEDAAIFAIAAQHTNPIPSYLIPGQSSRVYQACINIMVAGGRLSLTIGGTMMITPAEAESIIKSSCHHALNALREVEIGLGKDALRYKEIVLEIKRIAVLIAWMMWRNVPDSIHFGSKENLFDLGDELVGKYGLVVPSLS
ncbi:hypothetical protein ACM66B_004375 [Microbotryomycetes sp. NB124-2]